jgi:hypothetical protein
MASLFLHFKFQVNRPPNARMGGAEVRTFFNLFGWIHHGDEQRMPESLEFIHHVFIVASKNANHQFFALFGWFLFFCFLLFSNSLSIST